MSDILYHCRKLKASDLETVMHWRMQPEVTRFMNTDPVLTLEGQKLWFEKLSSADKFYYWIIEAQGEPCGIINLENIDKLNRRCLWGYYIAEKKMRSFHIAMSLEMSLYDYAFDKVNLNKVSGESFCENKAAVKMHELCGCETEGILKQHIFKNEQYYDVCIQSMLADTWRKIRSGFEYYRIEFDD